MRKKTCAFLLAAVLVILMLPLAAFGGGIEANGGIYEGDYDAGGKRSGYGVWTYHNFRYEGQWANDMPNGEGVLYEAWAFGDGNNSGTYTVQGNWVDGFANGAILTAEYANDSAIPPVVYSFNVAKGFPEKAITVAGLAWMDADDTADHFWNLNTNHLIAGVPPWADGAYIDVSAKLPPPGALELPTWAIVEAIALADASDDKAPADVQTEPKGAMGATQGNLANRNPGFTDMAALGDWVFYATPDDPRSAELMRVYKMHADGSQTIKLYEGERGAYAFSPDFRVVDDWLYVGASGGWYGEEGGGWSHKTQADDVALTLEVGGEISMVYLVIGDWCYDVRPIDGSVLVYKTRFDGSEWTNLGRYDPHEELDAYWDRILLVDDAWVYIFRGGPVYDEYIFNGHVFRELKGYVNELIKMKNQPYTEVIEIHPFSEKQINRTPQIVNGRLYYNEEHSLLSVSLDFTEEPVVIVPGQENHEINAFHATEDAIYYSEMANKTSAIMRVNHDGSAPTVLADGFKAQYGIDNILIAGDWMMFSCLEGKDYPTYLMRVDGTGLHKLGDPYIPEDAPGITDSTGKWRYDLLEDGSAVIVGAGGKLKPTGKLEIPSRVDKIPVTAIGAWAFSACEGFTSVAIPKGVTSIGDYAFQGCGGIKTATIPEGVTHIGEGVFQWCGRLGKVALPASLAHVGKRAFADCQAISLTVAKKNETFGMVDGVLFDKRQNMRVE